MRASGLTLAGGAYQMGMGKVYNYVSDNNKMAHPQAILAKSIMKTIAGQLSKGKGMRGCGKGTHTKFVRNIHKELNKLPGKYTVKQSKDFLNRNKNTKLSAQDVFGHDWKARGKNFMEAVNKRLGQAGGSFFGDIGKSLGSAWKKSTKEIGRFVAGKTKFKPHHLATIFGHVARIGGPIASALFPEFAAQIMPASAKAAQMADKGSDWLEKHGRGPSKPSKKVQAFIDMYPDAVNRIIQKGGGIVNKANIAKVAGVAITLIPTAIAFYKWYKKNFPKNSVAEANLNGNDSDSGVSAYSDDGEGNIIDTAGRGMTGKSCCKSCKNGGQCDSVTGKGFFKDLGNSIIHPPKPLINDLIDKAVAKKRKKKIQHVPAKYKKFVLRGKKKGSGIFDPRKKLTCEEKSRGLVTNKKTGKCESWRKQDKTTILGQGPRQIKKRGSKLEVWRGTADHTSSGLKKSDLMKNKRGKVVSIKQHKSGLAAFKKNGLSKYQKFG